MKREDRKYVALLVLAVALATTARLAAPEPLDWTWSFERDDTRPYGSTVIYDQLPALMPGAMLRPLDLPPFLVLRDTTRTGVNYVFVTPVFEPDPAETERLLDFATRGNTLFVVAATFRGALADSLKLETDVDPRVPAAILGRQGFDSLGVNFVNPRLRADSAWTFRRGAADHYFERFDSTRTTILGTNTDGRTNFIRLDVGQGAIFLNLVPLAFTNYHALSGGEGYVYRALSYLPVRETWWDGHYKLGRALARTPLRYILTHPNLRWAYYLLIAGALLFLVFEGKRRQRIIPVVAPPRNDTLDFVQTVGRLYYEHGNHADLVDKRIAFFLDYVRTRLRLPTSEIDDDFLDRVAERSGVPTDAVRATFAEITRVQNLARVTEADLRSLSDRIEAFYRQRVR